MKTRMRFVKTGSLKFIGHLDCMRMFQKAIRRAKLDVAYSQGYSPHQLMSFASPLGLGITSDGEYIDVEFVSLPDMNKEEFLEYFNSFLTDELFVTQIEYMDDSFKNSMALLKRADYALVSKDESKFDFKLYEQKWNEFISQDSIIVEKKTKKSTKEIDIKQHILEWSFCYEKMDINIEYEGNKLLLQLTSGSATNIKPELVLQSFFEFCGIEWNPYLIQVHRLQMYFD